MKTTALLLLTVFTIAQLNAQDINREITTDPNKPYLIGKIDKTGLEGQNYSSWFTKTHEDYQPNTRLIYAIASELKTYELTLFMGTWCGDSKEEVPKLYKVLEACNFPMEQLSVIAVSGEPDMYKQSPNHEEAGLNIHRVPTLIFFKNGKEVNRIIEHPIKSFEEDIKTIITTNNYQPNYQIVSELHSILEKKGIKGLKRKTKMLLKTYKNKVSSMSELNTYGYVLYTSSRTDEAIEVFKLNTKLFPNQPKIFLRLANILAVADNKDEAITVLEDALKLHPENTDIQGNLQVLKSN